jgi:hypothetical protein
VRAARSCADFRREPPIESRETLHPMQLHLHPHDRDGLPVEVVLSADEAEQWIDQIRSAVRDVREGQGEQLLLLGEPARVVLTVQERSLLSEGDPLAARYRDDADRITHREWLLTMGPAGVPVVMAFLAVAVFLALAWRFLP